jgi:mono/diheme cytochrome c family protein
MKKAGKIVAYIAILIVVLLIGVVTYVTQALPNVGPPEDIKVELTAQRIERGKYLVRNVLQCVDCHSKRDWTKFGGPIDTTALGGGGELFDAAGAGFPGEVYVPNITPYKLAGWTDGELFRAITTGQRKSGDAIFPLMPWPYYSKLDREDIYDVIAYIRSLKPVKADYPKSKLDFPLNIIVHTMPKKAELGTRPDPADTLKFGAYMVQAGACMECHSQDDKGTLLPGLEFAGGRAFKINGGTVKSANITPDQTTGIGNWTKEMFIAKFKSFADSKTAVSVKPGDFQTVMPWYGYGGMSENELGAIYTYLKTLKPVNNAVIKFAAN